MVGIYRGLKNVRSWPSHKLVVTLCVSGAGPVLVVQLSISTPAE